ncbi:MAG TPA: DUF2207 domain-containing protein, partial [Actinomycetaceae bacterium]|nr:DUF2207 domain-containing protein [Actinomycetaceae bacterium]
VALPVLYGVRRRRRGRDEHYPDLPPGVLPHAGTEPRVEQLATEPAVAVRFTPPDGLRPAEVGALDTKGTTTTHVTATIIDLAVRGFLRLEEAGTNWRGRVNDWTLVATPPDASAGELRDYERTLLERIFRGRAQVRLSQLRNTFAGTTRLVRRQLGSGLHAAGLVARPLTAGGSVSPLAFLLPLVFGSVFLFVGFTVVSVIVGRSTGLLGLIAVLLIIAFAVTRAVTRRARYPRTAAGRALHEQSRGFELYLSTAEAHQLRFEEGEDIFSRYLPYAIVYDVAERWAEIFAQLEAQGVRVQRPTWYDSPHGFHAGSFRSLGSSLSSFSSTAGTALTSTPGSSGSSGSRSGGGGGGGFSGGGGGGGGGRGR